MTSVSAGASSTCAISSTGALECWGYNGHGGLGNNSTISTHVPVDVAGLGAGVVAVSVSRGGGHSCALTSTGAVKCWGDNPFGALGG